MNKNQTFSSAKSYMGVLPDIEMEAKKTRASKQNLRNFTTPDKQYQTSQYSTSYWRTQIVPTLNTTKH